jgi:hypothetical protein
VKRGLGQLHGIRRPVAALRGRLHGPSLRRGNGPRAATRRPRADRRLGMSTKEIGIRECWCAEHPIRRRGHSAGYLLVADSVYTPGCP